MVFGVLVSIAIGPLGWSGLLQARQNEPRQLNYFMINERERPVRYKKYPDWYGPRVKNVAEAESLGKGSHDYPLPVLSA